MIFMLSLFACSDNKRIRDLHDYVAMLKKTLIKRPKTDYLSSIRLPTPVSFETAGKERDPFVDEVTSYAHQSIKDPIEAFPLKAYEFIGTITHQSQVWAIIRAPDNNVYQLTINDRIGNQYGRIMSIHSDSVDIEEVDAWQQGDIPGQGANKRIVKMQLKGGN